MNSLQVLGFGKLRLQYGNQVVVKFPTRQVEELLGFFLLHQGAHHGREKLITLLWPDSDPDKARGRFSTALWRLRAMFDELGTPADSYLHATREWVAFAPSYPLQIDIEQFQRTILQAESLTAVSAREKALVDALSLYKGELYEGIYSDWCLVERERLARLRLRAMGQMMASCLHRGAFAEAVEWGQAILADDPLREEVHRALMHCYQNTAQYGRAITQFQQCAQLLQNELAILPLPETIAVYQEIISERLKTLSTDSPDTAVQAAFANFQQAAARLNTLLEQRQK